MADDEMTDQEFHDLFNTFALRCPEPECGHEYEDDELGEREYDDETCEEIGGLTVKGVLDAYRVSEQAARIMLVMADIGGCPVCRSDELPAAVPINLIDELGMATAELEEDAAMIVERIPEMREQVEAMVAAAHATVRKVLGLDEAAV